MKKLIILLLALLGILIGCSHEEILEYNMFYRYENNEYIDINFYKNGSEENANDILCIIDYWNTMLDHEHVNDTKNNLAALNVNKYATLDAKLVELIKYTIDLSTSYKVVNPLYGTLKDLWDLHMITEELPTENECLTQIEVSLSTRVAINDNDVHLLGDGLIDLDYIKKGFIGEKIKEYLISKGIDRYVINYNADLVLYGKNKNGGSFETSFYGMKNGTYNLSDITLARVTADNNCFYTKDGRRWADIPSFVTGVPNDTFETLFVLGDDALKNSILAYAYYSLEVENVKLDEEKSNIMFAGYRDKNLVYRSVRLENLLVDER